MQVDQNTSHKRKEEDNEIYRGKTRVQYGNVTSGAWRGFTLHEKKTLFCVNNTSFARSFISYRLGGTYHRTRNLSSN